MYKVGADAEIVHQSLSIRNISLWVLPDLLLAILQGVSGLILVKERREGDAEPYVRLLGKRKSVLQLVTKLKKRKGKGREGKGGAYLWLISR